MRKRASPKGPRAVAATRGTRGRGRTSTSGNFGDQQNSEDMSQLDNNEESDDSQLNNGNNTRQIISSPNPIPLSDISEKKSNPTYSSSRNKKRPIDEVDKHLVEFLKKPKQVEDEHHHFGMSIAEQLRKMEPGMSIGGSRSRASIETVKSTQSNSTSQSNKTTNSRRGATHSSNFSDSKDNHNFNSTDRGVPGKNGKNTPEADNLAAPKSSNDYYLHKKFKKLTTTVDNQESSSPCSSKSVHLSNGLSTAFVNHCTNNIPSSNQTCITNGSNNDNNDTNGNLSVLESVIKSSTIQSSSNLCEDNSNPGIGMSSSFNGMVVYKPKFRISVETESISSDHHGSGCSSTSSSSPVKGASEDSDKSLTETPGKIAKSLRLDRQSLDDRISKIIDENQSLLEWPEHFTKKLKSHTSRNSHSSHNLHQRTNQLAIMSGGSTTELYPTNNNSTSNHRLQNGLVRHTSFDMTSSGGTVEFMTNPQILKTQNDILNNSPFSQIVQNTAKDFSSSSISDLSMSSLSVATSSLIVPKKRRRLSPTPSRLLCGGEVSELPVSDFSASKNYYQNVDMTVRVSNCSGAQVTIRTNGSSGSGGSIQSSVGFGRLIDSVPSPSIINGGNSSLFFAPNTLVSNLESKSLHQNLSESSFTGVTKSLPSVRSGKRKASKVAEISIEPLLPLVCPKLTGKVSNRETRERSMTLPSIDKPIELVQSKDKTKDFKDVSQAKTPFQVLQNTTNPKRPNFLALKPVNSAPKKNEIGVLPSPETPRVAKSYNQMSINGSAYTYLGFKVSTRSSYTCLFKPQPMFIPQNTDPMLSMYSNWQPCPRDPKELESSISTNDSRVNGRKSPQFLYTSATGSNSDTLTVSSPSGQTPILFSMSEKGPLTIFANNGLRAPVTSLSRSSEAVPLSIPESASKYSGPKLQISPNIPVNMLTSNQIQLKSEKSAIILPNGPMSSQTSHVSMSLLKSKSSLDMSSSELSSGEESSNLGKSVKKRRRKEDSMSEGPLALTTKSKKESNKVFMREDSNSASDSVKSGLVMSRSDSSRVRIMEGGFESNEDYTYVRGRGRGRYVCEACGIRCKKPSMLRKHLKTHTDLRPYTCKLCNFSFKTKGNLTKHQKSKSHHKKCISMGIHPDSSQSLAATGPNISISDTNSENDSDDDDDDDCGDLDQDMDSDSQCDDDLDATSSVGNDNNDSESVEKEIALSLLDLSSVSRLVSSASSSATDSDWSGKEKQPNTLGFSVTSILDDQKLLIAEASETPIDLSVKSKPGSSLIKAPQTKLMKLEKNGIVRSIGVVGEAQLWEPEEELVSNECLNLKKVLNTGNSLIPVQQKLSPEITLTREIKKELPEFQGERLSNGDIPKVKRQRQDSEASNSSSVLLPGSSAIILEKVSDRCSTPTISNLAPVKLHQPWLSPQDPSSKDTEKETEIPIEIKTSSAAMDSINSQLIEEAKAKIGAGDISGDISSPNSKLFSSFAGMKPQAEFRQPSGAQALVKEDGKAECNVCGKTFSRASQLTLHMNIHYIERPFRCDPCGVSFRTKGHLIKHRRSSSHDCKVYLTEAWGVANEENPRPFKCPECKIAFRIHGHLAKHLRSKMHIMRMECLGKLPFGIYFEMEKSGMNLNEIDTTDCDMSLVSLQEIARKIYGQNWMERLTIPVEEPV